MTPNHFFSRHDPYEPVGFRLIPIVLRAGQAPHLRSAARLGIEVHGVARGEDERIRVLH